MISWLPVRLELNILCLEAVTNVTASKFADSAVSSKSAWNSCPSNRKIFFFFLEANKFTVIVYGPPTFILGSYSSAIFFCWFVAYLVPVGLLIAVEAQLLVYLFCNNACKPDVVSWHIGLKDKRAKTKK